MSIRYTDAYHASPDHTRSLEAVLKTTIPCTDIGGKKSRRQEKAPMAGPPSGSDRERVFDTTHDVKEGLLITTSTKDPIRTLAIRQAMESNDWYKTYRRYKIQLSLFERKHDDLHREWTESLQPWVRLMKYTHPRGKASGNIPANSFPDEQRKIDMLATKANSLLAEVVEMVRPVEQLFSQLSSVQVELPGFPGDTVRLQMADAKNTQDFESAVKNLVKDVETLHKNITYRVPLHDGLSLKVIITNEEGKQMSMLVKISTAAQIDEALMLMNKSKVEQREILSQRANVRADERVHELENRRRDAEIAEDTHKASEEQEARKQRHLEANMKRLAVSGTAGGSATDTANGTANGT